MEGAVCERALEDTHLRGLTAPALSESAKFYQLAVHRVCRTSIRTFITDITFITVITGAAISRAGPTRECDLVRIVLSSRLCIFAPDRFLSSDFRAYVLQDLPQVIRQSAAAPSRTGFRARR
jgi:hypothetical protein